MSESLKKALLILDALRDSEMDLSARDLTGVIGLPKSTTQRLLQVLEESQMAAQDPLTKKYRLGPHTLALGTAYRERLDLRNVALPKMRRLRDDTGETIGLSIAVRLQRMFIEEVQSQSELRIHSELGRPYPIWMGAPGRVLLSGLPNGDLQWVLDQAGERAWRVADPPTREGLLERLEQIRRTGHDFARNETLQAVSALAVPIHDASGAVIAALSVSGPTDRMNGSTMDRLVPLAGRAATSISQAMGH